MVYVAKKDPPDKGKSPMQIFNAGAFFERLQMNILGPFPSSVIGNKYLLVIQGFSIGTTHYPIGISL